ncbi:uncharacterized protein sync [Pempheris klunzingeri]|uniref:uncharacterized protein sync n=1 Tax=Pempheris klunzingeri TaxID=3127111 RepID=UPI0039804FD6
MEDVDDNMSPTELDPLFIKEEDTAQSGLTFTGTQLNQSALMKPYLQEMDDLLKSCEELTGIPFGSHFSASYNETSLTESTLSRGKERDTMESYGETRTSPHAYLSPSYMDTHMDGAATEDQPAQGQSQGPDTILDRTGVTTEVPRQTEMPLTSVGNKLSETMVEYEGQLLGMLAMLEGCMEEAGMDFEPQDWATDASQEYVHISKNPHLYRGTTLVPIQQGRPVKSETEAMQSASWACQRAGEDKASDGNRNVVTVSSATNESRQNPEFSCDNMGGFSVGRLERQGNLKTDQMVLDPQFGFSDPTYCEAMTMGYMPTNEGKYTKGGVSGIEIGQPGEEMEEVKMDTIDLGSSRNELDTLGSQMEDCIQEVQSLEKRRKELLAEVLELRGNRDIEEAEGSNEEETEESIDSKVAELMKALKSEEQGRREERKREIQSLREERAEEERRMWKVNLERQGLQEELRKLKRRLFAMARDCAQSQFALNNQHREVELLKREEEKLQSLVLQLTEEGSQLRSAHQQKLSDLQAALHVQSSSQTSNTQDELTQCRRHSCGDIQQYLQGGLRALEERYEPILLALLKRREITAAALVKAKEQAQELRGQLRPLKEEIQKLNLQRVCLEEKLNLSYAQRREDVEQYKETVSYLEESSRELKTELKIQKRKTKEIEEMRESLTKQLLLYRAAIEDQNKCEKQKT